MSAKIKSGLFSLIAFGCLASSLLLLKQLLGALAQVPEDPEFERYIIRLKCFIAFSVVLVIVAGYYVIIAVRKYFEPLKKKGS